MINSIFCTVLPMGASKVVQTHKFDDFLDHTQFFLDLTGQLIDKKKVFRNDAMNNFEICNKLSKIEQLSL